MESEILKGKLIHEIGAFSVLKDEEGLYHFKLEDPKRGLELEEHRIVWSLAKAAWNKDIGKRKKEGWES